MFGVTGSHMSTTTMVSGAPEVPPSPARGLGTQKHWWSVPPPRVDTPRLTTRRAYTEVLLVFGLFFGASVAAAAFSVGGHSPSGVVAGWAESIPSSMQELATTILCILVPVLLVRRRGLAPADLGIAKPGTVTLGTVKPGTVKPGTVKLSQGIRIAAWALLALIGGSIVTGLLATGRFPEGPFSYPNLMLNLFHAAQAGFIEEVVVLAFVVVTLEQARRPRPEIIAVALVLRASYHIYYGPGVLGILIWAPVFLWLFYRFRTIVPLIIVHSAWDLVITLADHWPVFGGLGSLAMIALFIVAPILWLVERGERNNARRVPMLGPPGWYRDPAGTGWLRWFNGWNWAPEAHPPAPMWPPHSNAPGPGGSSAI
jgi:Type II CAAX prenyl endopeptidase Rce1-like